MCFWGYSSSQRGYRCYCPTLHKFVISANVIFFKSTPYFDKETSKSTSLEPEDDFISLENSSSYFNVDPMPQRYGQVYTRCAKFTTDVPLILVSPIIDMISGENVVITSSVDIDSSVDIYSQFDLDILIAHVKKRVCTLHSMHNFLFYAYLSTQYCAFIFSVDSS